MVAEKVIKLLNNINKTNYKVFDSELFRSSNLINSYTKDSRHYLVFGLRVKDEFCNLHGTLHGGAMSTLVDCMTTVHVWAADPFGRFAISTDLSVAFYLGVRPGQDLEITTELIGMNNNFAYTTALLTVGKDIVARGTQTLYFLNKTWTGP
jgi:acyl-coenzyme A thioesterase 13